jgi:UDPglucose 6-dehydrogenase
MREAPSRSMLEALWAMGASVSAYDPAAMEETRRIYGERADLLLVDSPMDALKGADALLIVTEWKVFRSPNFDTVKALLKTPLIFDGRNLMSRRRCAKWALIICRSGVSKVCIKPSKTVLETRRWCA